MSDFAQEFLVQPAPPIAQGEGAGYVQRLFVGRSLDLQSTGDQVLVKLFYGTRYSITSMLAVVTSGGATGVCAGGIYTAAAKGGSAFVAAAQSWLGLSAADKLVQPSLAGLLATDAQTASPLYFSLTTGSITPAQANLFVFGVVLD
jgi:hypothetical protein